MGGLNMVKGLAHICLSALDLAATERFYCSGLGLTKVFEFVRKNQVIGFYLKAGPNTFIEIFLRDKVVPNPDTPISHFCLEVVDIDDVITRLDANRYEVTPKKLGADQSWQAWAVDPAGTRIEFHQYTAQSHQFTAQPCILD